MRQWLVADAVFEQHRLAEIYDPLDADRSDLDPYVAMAAELSAQRILDIGCGTGTLACLLAQNGCDVIGLDPASASLDVARTKPHAGKVNWLLGDATSHALPQTDLILMTGNVAQVFLTDVDWISTLRAASSSLRPGGHLIFEVRDPANEGWKEWNRQQSFKQITLPDIGVVKSWVDLLDVDLPFVSFRWTFIFQSDGAEITSESTLRFRSQDEIAEDLEKCGFAVKEVRDAPDRPGREFVFISQLSK